MNFFIDTQFITNVPKKAISKINTHELLKQEKSIILDSKSSIIGWLEKNDITFKDISIVYCS
ncbi:hypothetical protein [Mycoplasma phocimorsus]|uniref:hypothetical protein n=1 Tax=Mycoplasma phocimorsus TaxID=3045839 RepID=UPI0024C0B6DC|nr:hypothetical protein [Mycoplasma phocimorsus]MDJ1647928.1 hypothetical protein [Mycoplasma phocimorsus]